MAPEFLFGVIYGAMSMNNEEDLITLYFLFAQSRLSCCDTKFHSALLITGLPTGFGSVNVPSYLFIDVFNRYFIRVTPLKVTSLFFKRFS
ncbi:Uncharacterised protein [Shewanella putrefaciens]|uniref:Uncharacterized protein n=1 Tax=Shewanella putrefaciens (strain CN-32 / ATCC BAA-453) TaxID=319224 RepID=A4Y3W1_SHEPC|nr:hypothetical protein SPWS13_1769 [Shewanella putrefaciens]MDR6963815.1 hypothetical protein [Shewanella putrefaciens]CAD6367303.1 hypothetical protein SHEWT2_02606 [Shewanella hafniensis]SUI66457.1 Uncharacterised protein [Shewanella putrefaciens]